MLHFKTGRIKRNPDQLSLYLCMSVCINVHIYVLNYKQYVHIQTFVYLQNRFLSFNLFLLSKLDSKVLCSSVFKVHLESWLTAAVDPPPG